MGNLGFQRVFEGFSELGHFSDRARESAEAIQQGNHFVPRQLKLLWNSTGGSAESRLVLTVSPRNVGKQYLQGRTNPVGLKLTPQPKYTGKEIRKLIF